MQEVKTAENQPNQAFPQELSTDGIRQLFSSGSHQECILQIIKIAEDYSQNRICHLSDGFCYISCLLTGEARLKHIKGELEVFDLVRVTKEDVIVLGLQRNPALELCNLAVLDLRLLCTIGEPVAYMTYFHNDFVNSKGSSRISEGQRVESTLTISDLLENYPHVPSKWILRAKVVRKPDNINPDKPFLVVRLMDEKENTIEAVFFGQVALDAHRRLVYNREYLFNNGQVKTKKNNLSEYEIKFSQQSQIIPIESVKSDSVKFQRKPQPSQQLQVASLTINDITNSPAGQTKLVTIAGKVLHSRPMKMGRSVQIIDLNSDVIEVVLWDEIKDEVKEGVTYMFANLRTKTYNSNLSLQSVRSKTTVSRAPQQIDRQPASSSQPTPNPLSTKRRELPDPSKLLTVSETVEAPVKEMSYKAITGFLVINTMYMDTKNFFKLDCPSCKNSQQFAVNPLTCRKCSFVGPKVRWNVRCNIMDQKESIRCVINEDLCEKLFRMSSLEGFSKLAEDKDQVRRRIEEVSHLEGIFRVKVNPYKDSLYYNIVDVYSSDSSVMVQRAYKDLKATMKKFIQS